MDSKKSFQGLFGRFQGLLDVFGRMGQGDKAGFELRWRQPDSVFEHLLEELGIPGRIKR